MCIDRVDDFIEERWLQHPIAKRRDCVLAEGALLKIPGIETLAVQATFRANHDSFIAMEDWQWKNGRGAQTLADFVKDGNWKYPAPTPKSKDQSDTEAAVAAVIARRKSQ